MRKAENVNAPNLWGWAIGAAAGLVAFGVLVIVGKFDLFPAAAMAAAVAGVAGMILGMPWGGSAPSATAPSVKDVAPAKPSVQAQVPPQPMTEAVAAPAAVVSAPVAQDTPPPVAKPKAAKPATKPKVAKPAAMAEGPRRLNAPRKGKADDLKEIEGIGPAMEKLANSLGFYHFDQIAGWSDADVALVDAEMKGFKGRITRDKWVAQAKIIVSEGLEAFRERAKTNNY
ncbi:endonuclease [Tabrizicola sp.]|uniref:endonuclease n=1 Tax=Tabrizicola sp. TaxID=2005166 RepID=UPI0026279BDF|nr:endonuclease [Tabrizicola sp.]MDM7930294.1 endonuclease [Tabrizicola sp.]